MARYEYRQRHAAYDVFGSLFVQVKHEQQKLVLRRTYARRDAALYPVLHRQGLDGARTEA